MTAAESNPGTPEVHAVGTQSAKTEPAPSGPPGKPEKANPNAAPSAPPNVQPAPKEGKAAVADRAKAASDLTPQLVERVHALYEELGRQDVLAVQELERTQKDSKEISH